MLRANAIVTTSMTSVGLLLEEPAIKDVGCGEGPPPRSLTGVICVASEPSILKEK